MRKSMSLILMLSGLFVSCGDDADSKESASDGGPGDGQDTYPGAGDQDASPGGGKYPGCNRSDTPKEIPGYTGVMPSFSRADLMACQMKCTGMGIACFVDTNCPGVELWNECAFENVIACVGSEGKSCRTQLEDFECCAGASGCDASATDPSCIQTACAEEIATFQKCYNGDAACNMSAPTGCFSAMSVAM